jgi:hypothetical protein
MPWLSRSLFIPLVLFVVGLVPLGVVATTSASDRAATTVAITQLPSPTPAPKAVVVTTPPPEIDGVSDQVARVLAARGFAAQEAVDELPESVIAVLQHFHAVLTIPVPKA